MDSFDFQNKNRYYVTTCPEKQKIIYNTLNDYNIRILSQNVFLGDQVVFFIECYHEQLSSVKNLNVNIYDER